MCKEITKLRRLGCRYKTSHRDHEEGREEVGKKNEGERSRQEDALFWCHMWLSEEENRNAPTFLHADEGKKGCVCYWAENQSALREGAVKYNWDLWKSRLLRRLLYTGGPQKTKPKPKPKQYDAQIQRGPPDLFSVFLNWECTDPFVMNETQTPLKTKRGPKCFLETSP